MNKFSCIFFVFLIPGLVLKSQDKKMIYPEPEFSNEITFLKKDSTVSAMRLEKGSSKLETKSKMGGFAGSESGYLLDGGRSPVQLHSGQDLIFIYSTGAPSASSSSTNMKDSMMRANGLDPATINAAMAKFMDPGNQISLYKVESENGTRKILMQKNGGAMPFASKKTKSSDKFSFSVKKIREGYYELIIDKSLSRGEYAFTLMSMGNSNGTIALFAFGVD